MTSAGAAADSALKRIFKNAGVLVTGKGIAALLGLGVLAVAARTLGPSDMGALVLAHAYAMTIAGIARFQSWQAVIRFGAPLVTTDAGELKRLLRFTIRIDALSAVIGVALALLIAPLAAQWFGWSDGVLALVRVYAFVVPFLMGATPTGVLRLFGRFKTLGAQMNVMPAIRLVGSLIAAFAGGGVEAFLIVWIASAFANGVTLWILGWRELARRGLTPSLIGKTQASADPAWLPFMLKTNGASTLDLVNESVPVLIVGGVLGQAAAGFFQLAQNVTNVLAHPTNMLNHATFPELARIEAEKGPKETFRVALQSSLGALAAALPLIALFVLFRDQIATIVGGDDFGPAGIVVAGLALYQIVRIVTVVFESAAIARGKAGVAFFAQMLGATGLIASMLLLLPPLGVAAAALTLAIGRLLMLAVLSTAVVRA